MATVSERPTKTCQICVPRASERNACKASVKASKQTTLTSDIVLESLITSTMTKFGSILIQGGSDEHREQDRETFTRHSITAGTGFMSR